MSEQESGVIHRLKTGVPGLDDVLGGGLPEFSFNIIAGAPGAGKTTLAHQIAFANATPERPVLYFTVLGEPALKMLRYQQQFGFFDPAKMGSSIRFVNLSRIVLEADLGAVLDEIVREVEASSPGIVIVDSFRTVIRKADGPDGEMQLQGFVQKLALHLTSWQATTFLIGEYSDLELRDNPVFTVADGLIWLSQSVSRNSMVRKLQVLKMRGQAPVPGLHTFRITRDGLEVFPRNFGLSERPPLDGARRLLSTGIPELDKMMGGGIPQGDSVLVAGASGTGKSLIATRFLSAGIQNGEPGLGLIFEERPKGYAERADSFGMHLGQAREDGMLKLLYLRPLDLSVDEAVSEILEAVEETGATRVVIDSLPGFEMALAPSFREDFRESLYRMFMALTGAGVTIMSTTEVTETFTGMPFSSYSVSFLTDDIIRLRYVEMDGELRKALVVVKMRNDTHSKEIREYEITSEGVEIGKKLLGWRGIVTGVPERT